MSDVVEAAGLLLFSRSKPTRFLLMKHTNRWDLPKGHAETGEDLLSTALRETEEETGIPRRSIAVDPDFRHVLEYSVNSSKRGEYRKRVTYFLGFLPDCCDVVLSEHVGYEWFPWPPKRSIQPQTIDPLLAAARAHFERSAGNGT